jgi:hypothetical protein
MSPGTIAELREKYKNDPPASTYDGPCSSSALFGPAGAHAKWLGRFHSPSAGADDFLPKPFNREELLTRIRSLLRIKRYHDTIKAQAAELLSLNRTLEDRVQTQLEELGRLQRLRRFLSPQLADAIVSSGDESILRSHRRQVSMFFGRPARLDEFRRHRRARGADARAW